MFILSQLFESNDLMALSQRLSSLRQSLDLLNHVSDYSERMMQLDGLRNRLEALASPSLVSAISSSDTAKTAAMVQVLVSVQDGVSTAVFTVLLSIFSRFLPIWTDSINYYSITPNADVGSFFINGKNCAL